MTELAGTVRDLGIEKILRPGPDTPGGEQQVPANEQAEAAAQRERDRTGRVLRGEPVNDVDHRAEDGEHEEDDALDLHGCCSAPASSGPGYLISGVA